MDNRPNENTILCKIFLQLFEIPSAKQNYENINKTTARQKLKILNESP